ncbi:hypothetical protein GEMRC1_011047 [Eukaryota sp. GEM-RC1]
MHYENMLPNSTGLLLSIERINQLENETNIQFREIRDDLDLRFNETKVQFRDMREDMDLRFNETKVQFREMNNRLDGFATILKEIQSTLENGKSITKPSFSDDLKKWAVDVGEQFREVLDRHGVSRDEFEQSYHPSNNCTLLDMLFE